MTSSELYHRAAELLAVLATPEVSEEQRLESISAARRALKDHVIYHVGRDDSSYFAYCPATETYETFIVGCNLNTIQVHTQEEAEFLLEKLHGVTPDSFRSTWAGQDSSRGN